MAVTTQVRLANEIATQFRHLSHDAAVEAIGAHLRAFWEPRMRSQLAQAITGSDPDVDPLVAEAVGRLMG
jgi:formate dehydrogenase subunit delta